ncbi:hypothetical protein PHYSODRAFT_518778 [Phytophthora sojae]|uniref:DDE Tnp4 domain-containing protein n=1 Tax=Phytophthora sojae (strain P6497) TaxID=1094619 RepID=G4ZZL9_PHYSP|nr:hypothetical protein PHYSODRAFT_518778 [Phytophthora sojae]EGZ10365.1 hypothetical protein PHYSODRAFT_518778 [Phytophthora sojae]|eukprot:XP_009533110.1 hypothetical protein PHYSODRAFT_518778 [Phytophthora sojae]
MEPKAVAIAAVLLSTCATALTTATIDKRSCRRAPSTKLCCDRASFLRLYREVHAAYKRKPAANSKCPLVKRFALTMMYFAQGGTMDSAASVMGILRPRAVHVDLPSASEVEAVEAGFFKVAGFPGVVGAGDGTLIAIPRPHDFEGWYYRKGFPAVNVQAIVDHRGSFRSISIRSGSNNDQSLWSPKAVSSFAYCSFATLIFILTSAAVYQFT